MPITITEIWYVFVVAIINMIKLASQLIIKIIVQSLAHGAFVLPFLDPPTAWSWWCGSWSRAGRRESWPSPSQVGVDHELHALPSPRRSSAASGGVAATPGSSETKFTIRHVGCYFPFNMQIHAWSNHVMVCQKSRLNYAAKILAFMQSSWKRKHEVSLVGDCFGLGSPLPLHC